MSTGNLKVFSGKVANVVGYQLYGKQRLRSTPSGMRQTQATIQSGRLFGKASSVAASIRHNLDILPYPSDIKMQTRLTSCIYKWLKENDGKANFAANHLPFIEGYQFVEEGYTLADRMRISIDVDYIADNGLRISIPAFIPKQSIIAPAYTGSVDFHFTAVFCPINRPMNTSFATTSLNFVYNEESTDEQSFFLDLASQSESLLVTVLALRYLLPGANSKQASAVKGFQPTAIINAMSL